MGDALAAPLFAALLAIAPAFIAGTPTPAPLASDRPLREIGRVHATSTFCKTALEHATSGIDVILDNDAQIALVEYDLRQVDLDSSKLNKYKGAARLNERYVALRRSAVKGNGILKELKAEAAFAPTDDQKVAMLALANAVDGALARQKRLADVVGRMVAYFDSHDPLSQDEHDKAEFDAIESQNHFFAPHPAQGPLVLVPDMLSDIAKHAADDLQTRQILIFTDEDEAARKIDPAFAAC